MYINVKNTKKAVPELEKQAKILQDLEEQLQRVTESINVGNDTQYIKNKLQLICGNIQREKLSDFRKNA